MAATGEGGLKLVHHLVTALKEFRCLMDPDSRELCLELVATELDATLTVRNHRVTHYFLAELAKECLDNERVMWAVRQSLAILSPDAPAMKQLDSVMEQMTARPALPTDATERLRSLLEGLEVEHLARLCRGAAGPLQEVPPVTGPWHAFETLTRMNARPDGLTPGLALVEYLAASARPLELADRLRGWADEQARELSLTSPLRSLRQQVGHAAPAESIDAYLVIQLLPQDEPGRYELSSWHAYDPTGWYPVRGPASTVTTATAERAVQDLVHEAVVEWEDARSIHLEFVLSAEDLHLPVHMWRDELDSDFATPLCSSYSVVVRSLERSQTRHWYRPWKKRWQTFSAQPERSRQLVVDGPDPDSPRSGDPSALVARLNADQHVFALVLNAPPGTSQEGSRQAAAAWRAGIPVVVWDQRHPRDPYLVHQLRQKPVEANGDLARLREAVKELRLEAQGIGSAEREQHLGQHVMLVWDDPTRPVGTQGRVAGPDEGVGSR
jgi:vWA-MoxR associated protein C-terminal domain/vWA-MoxR associated protein middle region 0/Effector-associated domain 2